MENLCVASQCTAWAAMPTSQDCLQSVFFLSTPCVYIPEHHCSSRLIILFSWDNTEILSHNIPHSSLSLPYWLSVLPLALNVSDTKNNLSREEVAMVTSKRMQWRGVISRKHGWVWRADNTGHTHTRTMNHISSRCRSVFYGSCFLTHDWTTRPCVHVNKETVLNLFSFAGLYVAAELHCIFILIYLLVTVFNTL